MKNIKGFIERWRGKGQEKSDDQDFWRDFLETVCEVENTLGLIEFQKKS